MGISTFLGQNHTEITLFLLINKMLPNQTTKMNDKFPVISLRQEGRKLKKKTWVPSATTTRSHPWDGYLEMVIKLSIIQADALSK